MNVFESELYKKQIKEIARTIEKDNFTVLITGASGLIGSCLVDIFVMASITFGKNIKIVALGRSEEKLKRRFSYTDYNGIVFLAQNVKDPLEFDTPIDYIIHAASNADPVSYSLYPAETLLTNILGAYSILEYCKNHKKTRVLLTSTFEVYGRIEGQDIYRECDSGEIDLNAIRSCYPESKRCSEILMRCYKREYDVDFVITRLCSIYGPTMTLDDSKAHAQFVRDGLSGEKIVLKSKGEQKRTYCYLMDAASGILTVLFKGQSGEAYNIANEEGMVAISDVAREIAKICETEVAFDIPSEIERKGFSRPQNCILDNRKLKDLGWEGKYTLFEGLSSTISVLREIQL